MSEIDIQNAKQIRDPMQVQINVYLSDDDIDMTYSGYSSAKVADGELDERNWPMRKLADLQGDGFPLDGSCVLYNASTSPSQTNGKLGVRGNVGEAVTVTATGSKTIPALLISVTNAASVTYGGSTTQITTATITVPILTTSAVFSFAPASSDRRIEISEIRPVGNFNITNNNLIRATVSLRSDLSLFNQTLPESEINIEVYHPIDVSEDAAKIPADTPISYTAGYPGNWSPARSFYVSGKVTWADNVLSIQGVDAVHFFDDFNIVAPVTAFDSYDATVGVVRYILDRLSIDYDCAGGSRGMLDSAYRWIVPESTNAREYIAFLNQCFCLTDAEGNLLDGTGQLQDGLRFFYRDAGLPYYTTNPRPDPTRVIREEDCADIKKDVDRMTSTTSVQWRRITNDIESFEEGAVQQVGSATMLKGIGTTLSFDKYSVEWRIGLFLGRNYDNDIATKMMNKYGTVYGWGYTMSVVPGQSDGYEVGFSPVIYDPYVGYKLQMGEIPQSEFYDYPPDDSDVNNLSGFIPWAQKYDNWRYDTNPSHVIKTATQMWNVLKNAKVVDAQAETLDLDIYGFAFNFEDQIKTYTTGENGALYDYGDAPILGRLSAEKSNGSTVEIFPSKMLASPMYKSPITGSFTWKGDPRMQPRDVVEWERLDGTTTTITLENITLTHEGGGTMAEITYREGVV